MTVDYEEKTYENYFNTELDLACDIYFPLGQVQEGNFGFDSSSFSSNRKLWSLLGYPLWYIPPFEGVDLPIIANEVERILRVKLKKIPTMKVNLLFQYKRPEFMEKSSSKEWIHWKQPYYRYDIYNEQQKLLMNIENVFGSEVFIVYACPAVSDVNELVDAKIKRKIIEISNFKRASALDKHHRNTFLKAGTYSIACSDSERLENFDIINEIKELSGGNLNGEKNNIDFIISFRKQLVSLMTENKYYSISFNLLNEQYKEIQEYELLYSLIVLKNFRNLTGVQWLVKL